MSRSVNRVILLGHVGKDPLTKFTPSGKSKTTFSMATNRKWKDKTSGDWKEETDWHNIVVWENEQLQNYLAKGKQVYVQGRITTRSWDDEDSGQKRYITEIIADEVILLGAKEKEEEGDRPMASGPRPQPMRSAPRSAPRPLTDEITDDDVPF